MAQPGSQVVWELREMLLDCLGQKRGQEPFKTFNGISD